MLGLPGEPPNNFEKRRVSDFNAWAAQPAVVFCCRTVRSTALPRSGPVQRIVAVFEVIVFALCYLALATVVSLRRRRRDVLYGGYIEKRPYNGDEA